jgi:hypothetical protein
MNVLSGKYLRHDGSASRGARRLSDGVGTELGLGRHLRPRQRSTNAGGDRLSEGNPPDI